jgi:uncharacterized membrane protein (DUF106 family)
MKKITAGVLAFSIIAILGIGLIAAFPFGNFNLNKDLTEEERAEMQEFHDAIQQAIEDGDFETWKSLMESQLTEENFNALVERHNQMSEEREANEEIREQIREARESGDYETANKLQEQLGKDTMGFERGKNFGMRGEPPFGCQNSDLESDSE